MTTRRKAVVAMIAAPVAALTDADTQQTPHLELSHAAFKRIAEILEKGGKITSISYKLPKGATGMRYGTAFLTRTAERDWRIVR